MTTSTVEEYVSFPSGDLLLSGILSYPQRKEPEHAVLLCSPHPQFAGNMENNVIQGLSQAYSEKFLTLRFDYRGVGTSEIQLQSDQSVFDYWENVEENQDYQDALQDVHAAYAFLHQAAPNLHISIIGYSFGAIVGLKYGLQIKDIHSLIAVSAPFTRMDFSFMGSCHHPSLMISGNEDFVYNSDEIKKLHRFENSNLQIYIWENMDHFFRGEEPKLGEMIRDFIARHSMP